MSVRLFRLFGKDVKTVRPTDRQMYLVTIDASCGLVRCSAGMGLRLGLGLIHSGSEAEMWSHCTKH